jgi:hypothetical protein
MHGWIDAGKADRRPRRGRLFPPTVLWPVGTMTWPGECWCVDGNARLSSQDAEPYRRFTSTRFLFALLAPACDSESPAYVSGSYRDGYCFPRIRLQSHHATFQVDVAACTVMLRHWCGSNEQRKDGPYRAGRVKEAGWEGRVRRGRPTRARPSSPIDPGLPGACPGVSIGVPSHRVQGSTREPSLRQNAVTGCGSSH